MLCFRVHGVAIMLCNIHYILGYIIYLSTYIHIYIYIYIYIERERERERERACYVTSVQFVCKYFTSPVIIFLDGKQRKLPFLPSVIIHIPRYHPESKISPNLPIIKVWTKFFDYGEKYVTLLKTGKMTKESTFVVIIFSVVIT